MKSQYQETQINYEMKSNENYFCQNKKKETNKNMFTNKKQSTRFDIVEFLFAFYFESTLV